MRRDLQREIAELVRSQPELANMPPEQILEMAAAVDLGIWSEVKVGFTNSGYHWEWYELAQHARRLALIAPREHGKSECVTVNNASWTSIYNPGFWTYIFCNSGDQGEKILSRIASTVSHVAPHLVDKAKVFHAKEIVFANDARVTVRGSGAAVRGAHPDLIIGDDVQDENNDQPDFCKVLTPSGWRRIDSLSVGDEIVDPDGHKSYVTGVFPKGNREIFRVTLSDGSTTLAGPEHLWRVRVRQGSQYVTRVMTTEWMMSKNLSGSRISIAPLVPYDGTKKLDLPPYVVGALIGDGTLGGKAVKFTTGDSEIAQRVQQELPDMLVKQVGEIEYQIVNPVGHKNRVRRSLDRMSLRKGSKEKRLPEESLFLSAADRLDLLRGLMDTDGCLSKSGQSIFVTTSRGLADDVVDLVRSLGGRTSVQVREKGWYTSPNQPERREVGPSYRVTVSLNECPFLMERKSRNWKPRQYRKGSTIVSVERTGLIVPTRCIKVSADSHCYVTDDFIATHNTSTQMQRERLKQWWFGTVGGMAHPGTTRVVMPVGKKAERRDFPATRILLVGTPFHSLDLLMSCKDNPMYRYELYSAMRTIDRD